MMAKSRGRCDSHESHRPLKLYGSKINHLQVVGIAFVLSEKFLWWVFAAEYHILVDSSEKYSYNERNIKQHNLT